MALPRDTHKKLGSLLAVTLLAWIVELVGLIFLQRSCAGHKVGGWETGAQLPASDHCGKVYRYLWWAVFIELPLVLGLASSMFGWGGSSYNTLARYRLGWLAYTAIVTSLTMWAANVTLNLTDTAPSLLMGDVERTRAWVTFAGFAVISACNIILLFVLGDDGEGLGAMRDPLLGGTGVAESDV